MYRKYLLVCVLFLWILVEGCHCCKSYANSGIPQGCEELHIDNGNACYEELYWGWKATFSCNTGFYLKGSDTRSCTWYWLFIRWDWDNQHTQCIREPTETTPQSSLTSTTRTQKPITHTTAATTTTTSNAISTISMEISTKQNDDNSLIAVYVTVPVLAVGIIVGGLLFLFLYRRRGSASAPSSKSSKETTFSTVTNQAYEEEDRDHIPAKGAKNNNANYIEIPEDAVDQKYVESEYHTINSNDRIIQSPNRDVRMIIGPKKDENCEYNTINSGGRIHSDQNNDGRMNKSPNYNHIVLPSDSDYDHTTNPVSMKREESDTYSHINGTIQQNHRPNLINQSDNIYNRLRLNTGEFDKSAINVQNENSYDHTEKRVGKHNVLDDTYAHVDKRLEEVSYTNTQECIDYFILEKIEHNT